MSEALSDRAIFEIGVATASSSAALGSDVQAEEAIENPQRWNSNELGLWGFLATAGMLFAGFTSAYLVRRVGGDWQPIALPPILFLNSALLLASSVAIEIARRRLRNGLQQSVILWLSITTVLGVGFLAGQFVAWKILAESGIYLPSSPHSSFFYVLTAVHAAHLLGGLAALAYVLGRALRGTLDRSSSTTLRLTTVYWHFVDGVWIYLFVLMSWW